MKKLVALLFAVSFIVGWFVVGPAPVHIHAGEATGFALLPTAVGWLVAKNADYRWSAAVVSVVLAIAWIGR